MTLEITSTSTKELKFCAIVSFDAIQQFSQLLDLCFPVRAGNRFFDDFPIWNPKYKTQNIIRLGIFSDEQLICTCAVRQAVLKKTLTTGSLAVSLIGAVATHPSWRGQGLASLLVQRALIWSEQQGANIAFLWGSEHTMYQRLGFDLCGEQVRIPLRDLNLQNLTEKYEPKNIFRTWVPELFDFIRLRPNGLQLDERDQLWFEAHKNVDWYYSKNEQHLTAYAAYGRGIDLQDIVHEWGGEKEDLKKILCEISHNNPEAELLGPSSLVPDFGISETSATREYLCMAKIVNPLSFFSSAYPNSSVNFEFENGKWKLSYGGRLLGSLTKNQLVKQFLGPKQPLGFIAELPTISLWIWGLDAV